MRGSQRALGVAVAALMVAGLVAAVAMQGDDGGTGVIAGGGPTSTTATSDATTTAPGAATAEVPATTLPPPAPTTEPATTAPPPTAGPTTTAGPARSFSVEPSSGPPGTPAKAAGTGCHGEGAGVSLEFSDPSGQPATGDGASARPDGTWEVPFSYPSGPRGRWTVRATCGGPTGFEYPERVSFTIT